MRLAGRVPRHGSRWRAVAALAVAAGVAAVAVAAGPAASAAARTITVAFTDNGPDPGSVHATVGDTVTYVNKLSQDGTVTVAPGLDAQVSSASVKVHGAGVPDFTLPAGRSRSVTYTAPANLTYTATYTMALLPVLSPLGVNLVPPSTVRITSGKVLVAPVARPAQHAGGAQPPSHGALPPARSPATGAAPAGRQAAGAALPGAPGPGVAAGVVPQGAGSAAAAPRAPVPQGAGPAGQADQSPLLSSGGTAGHDLVAARRAALGRSAVLAVILLSLVAAALIRSLVVGDVALPALRRRAG
jgi:plastocyanin